MKLCDFEIFWVVEAESLKRIIFKDLFCFYLKDRRRRRDIEKDPLSTGFTSQMPATVATKPMRSQEPRASSGSPACMQGLKDLGCALLLAQAISRELPGKCSSHMGCWCCSFAYAQELSEAEFLNLYLYLLSLLHWKSYLSCLNFICNQTTVR